MSSSSRFPISSAVPSIEEAKALVRQCAEPRPSGDLVKVAIFRASRRLNISIRRTRDIWYGGARRIDSVEMDQLRRCAAEAELAKVEAAIEFLNDKGFASAMVTAEAATDFDQTESSGASPTKL